MATLRNNWPVQAGAFIRLLYHTYLFNNSDDYDDDSEDEDDLYFLLHLLVRSGTIVVVAWVAKKGSYLCLFIIQVSWREEPIRKERWSHPIPFHSGKSNLIAKHPTLILLVAVYSSCCLLQTVYYAQLPLPAAVSDYLSNFVIFNQVKSAMLIWFVQLWWI